MSNFSSCVSVKTAVLWSGATRASASSGHSTISSSALGIRTRVASSVRGSMQIVCQPSSPAAEQSASAVSTAPITTRRGGGP